MGDRVRAMIYAETCGPGVKSMGILDSNSTIYFVESRAALVPKKKRLRVSIIRLV